MGEQVLGLLDATELPPAETLFDGLEVVRRCPETLGTVAEQSETSVAVAAEQARTRLVMWLEFPRFRGHLTGGPSGLLERMSVDAKDAAVFEAVPRRGGATAEGLTSEERDELHGRWVSTPALWMEAPGDAD